jgi:hypothetical protein
MIICLLLNSCSKKTTNEDNINLVDIYSYDESFSKDESASIEVVDEPFVENENIIDETIYNYNNGNGTILEQIIINNITWTVRKHEDNCINDTYDNYNVYENLGETDGNVLFVLSYSMDFSILELAYSNKRKNDFDLWLKIKNEHGLIGWINVSGNYNPYRDGAWSILEIIELENIILTVRKVRTQWLETIQNLNVRDKPSLAGEILINFESESELVTIIAMTEENEIINGKKDPWLKIIDNDGNIGWIFGGDAFVFGRGGFKYRTPHYDVIAPFVPW